MSTLREILIMPINSTIWRHNDLDYATASIKLCPEVGNDEYFIVCNFGSRRMSQFKVIEQ